MTLGAIILIFSTALPSFSSVSPVGVSQLEVDDVRIGTEDGNIARAAVAFEPLIISSRLTNYQSTESRFSLIFEIRDSNGVTVSLDVREGNIGPKNMIRASSIWIPEKPDDYEIRNFAVNDLDAPEILSSPQITSYPASNGSTTIFGCGIYGPVTHCDRLPNMLASHRLQATWEKIYSGNSTDAGFVPGRLGKALKIQAYNEDFVEIQPGDHIFGAEEFSISFWVMADPSDQDLGHVLSYLNSRADAGWAFEVDDPIRHSIKFEVPNDQGELFATNGVIIPVDTFVNIIGTFDGSDVRIYYNGALSNSIQFTGNYDPNPASSLKIAMAAYCFSCASWGGTFDDIQVFDRTLTPQEIESIVSGELGQLGNEAGLPSAIGHWDFENGFSDVSGNDANGVLRTPAVSMMFDPDGRLFFTEKNTGQIRVMNGGIVQEEPFVRIADVKVGVMSGLLGLAIDPLFSQNRFVYVFYTTTDTATGEDFSRVVRYKDANGQGTEMTIILDRLPSANEFDTGGALAFGPEQKLYVSVGDGIPPYADDPNILLSQDPESLFGKVLRINRDGSIPDNNPFPDSPVFTVGHKNTFGIAFDRDGIGIAADNGESTYDEINLIEKGGNYGWPTLQPHDIDPELSNSFLGIKPLRTYWQPIAPTQAVYYDGDRFPELKGKFLFGSYNRGALYAVELDSDKRKIVNEEVIMFPNVGTMPIISVAVSPTGEIYLGAHDIYKLESIDNSTRQQMLWPIRTDVMSPDIGIPQIYYDRDAGTIIADLVVNNTTIDTDAALGSPISITIPNSLIERVDSVTLLNSPGGAESPLDFSVENDSSTSAVIVRIENYAFASGNSKIVIAGLQT
jgi:glucose/arabinose dehydrogenase